MSIIGAAAFGRSQLCNPGRYNPASLSADIFERFYRARSQDKTGSGLGLAIVKQAALRMNCTVTLAPGPGGRGCRFVVRIAAPR